MLSIVIPTVQQDLLTQGRFYRKVNTSEHIVRKGGLPEELVKEVSGQVAFEEEGPRIFPLSQFPDNTINLASAQLVNSHKNKFVDERIYGQVGVLVGYVCVRRFLQGMREIYRCMNV